MITTGSHFSGYGSYLFALDSLGIKYKSKFACDNDKYVKQTYLANHDTERFFHDVTCDDVQSAPPVDLFISSPPCQSFSTAGKREGDNDQRGVLFEHSYNYIKNKRPKYFVIENVPGLVTFEKGRVFNTWLKMLGRNSIQTELFCEDKIDSCGYFVRWFYLNSKNVGFPEPVPHNRNRVFIVGFR